jgi:hypothetical protein
MPTALILLDLLSHQGALDGTPFDLAAECLSTGLILPSHLFIFSDLSALATGFLPPLSPTLTPAERLVAVLGPRARDAQGRAVPGPLSLEHGKAGGVRALLRAPSDAAARLAPLVDFALLPEGPGHAQCHLGALPSGEALMKALRQWLGGVVAPRLAGCNVVCALFTHGGFAAVHSATHAPAAAVAAAAEGGASHCLADDAIAGLSSGAERFEPENFSMAWVAQHLVLPLAQAVGPAGSLTWIQGTCFAPTTLRSLASELQARTGQCPVSHFGAGSAGSSSSSSSSSSNSNSSEDSASNEDSVLASKRSRLSPAARPRLMLISEKPLYSPLKDATISFGQGAWGRGCPCARCTLALLLLPFHTSFPPSTLTPHPLYPCHSCACRTRPQTIKALSCTMVLAPLLGRWMQP